MGAVSDFQVINVTAVNSVITGSGDNTGEYKSGLITAPGLIPVLPNKTVINPINPGL